MCVPVHKTQKKHHKNIQMDKITTAETKDTKRHKKHLSLPLFALLPWIKSIYFFSSRLSTNPCLFGHVAGLPYYAGMPGVPSAFQYGPTVFMPPGSAKQPTMGLANPSSQYHTQHQAGYGQHAYGTGKSPGSTIDKEPRRFCVCTWASCY